MKKCSLTVFFLLGGLIHALATTYFVDAGSTNPTPPYLDWSTAATNIQDAVTLAATGDEVVVTNGFYRYGGAWVGRQWNRVLVTRPITIRSVNGPDQTVIYADSYLNPTTNLLVRLTNGAALIGFTLTNGTSGVNGVGTPTGIGLNGYVSNCWILGSYQGGVGHCQLDNCIISNNVGGPGASLSILNNCMIISNQATIFADAGGAYKCNLYHCQLIGNNAPDNGGGAYQSVLNNCLVASNTASGDGGGTYQCTLTNCVLIGNWATSGGGDYSGKLYNCILSGNQTRYNYYVPTGGSQLFNCALINNAGPPGGSSAYNCIVYYNPNLGSNQANHFNHCCVDVLTPDSDVAGNFTNAPLFLDLAGGNLRLQTNSPCINAGYNGYAPAGPDLDGNPRIAGGTVDVGPYEFQSPTSLISYAWLQTYGFPIDGSADHGDPDGDGLDNFQEWIAGTVPTDAASVLSLLSPAVTPSGVGITWNSVAGRNYRIERRTDLGSSSSFVLLQSNIVGLTGTTTFFDTNSSLAGPMFYRVGVAP